MHITFWLVIAEPLTWYWVAKLENNIIEFDAQPVSALSAQIDSFSGVTTGMSTFETVTGVMINIVIKKSVRKHILSTPSKLHFCRNYSE